MTETWKPVGCYQNRGKALGEILFKFKRFGKMKKKYGQCVTKANQEGVTIFGLDDTRCWTGQNAASSYGIYGTAASCRSTKSGLRYGFLSSETVFVYQKKGGKLMGQNAFCFANVIFTVSYNYECWCVRLKHL